MSSHTALEGISRSFVAKMALTGSLGLGLSVGCATNGASELEESAEQAATAAQDIEVARLRALFASGDSAELRDLAPDEGARWWTCEERDATLDSPSVQNAVGYTFRRTADGLFVTNEGTGFGKKFVRAENDMVGLPESPAPGGLITVDVVRKSGADVLVVERVLRPTADGLSPADQLRFDAQRARSQAAIAFSKSLALAYSVCHVASPPPTPGICPATEEYMSKAVMAQATGTITPCPCGAGKCCVVGEVFPGLTRNIGCVDE
jgi:hypothetical protein